MALVEWRIGPGEDFPTIQAAVNAVPGPTDPGWGKEYRLIVVPLVVEEMNVLVTGGKALELVPERQGAPGAMWLVDTRGGISVAVPSPGYALRVEAGASVTMRYFFFVVEGVQSTGQSTTRLASAGVALQVDNAYMNLTDALGLRSVWDPSLLQSPGWTLENFATVEGMVGTLVVERFAWLGGHMGMVFLSECSRIHVSASVLLNQWTGASGFEVTGGFVRSIGLGAMLVDECFVADAISLFGVMSAVSSEGLTDPASPSAPEYLVVSVVRSVFLRCFRGVRLEGTPNQLIPLDTRVTRAVYGCGFFDFPVTIPSQPWPVNHVVVESPVTIDPLDAAAAAAWTVPPTVSVVNNLLVGGITALWLENVGVGQLRAVNNTVVFPRSFGIWLSWFPGRAATAAVVLDNLLQGGQRPDLMARVGSLYSGSVGIGLEHHAGPEILIGSNLFSQFVPDNRIVDPGGPAYASAQMIEAPNLTAAANLAILPPALPVVDARPLWPSPAFGAATEVFSPLFTTPPAVDAWNVPRGPSPDIGAFEGIFP